jgi:hypothetical protein
VRLSLTPCEIGIVQRTNLLLAVDTGPSARRSVPLSSRESKRLGKELIPFVSVLRRTAICLPIDTDYVLFAQMPTSKSESFQTIYTSHPNLRLSATLICHLSTSNRSQYNQLSSFGSSLPCLD